MTANIANIIAKELNIKITQAQAAIDLLNDGASVPFIARYRKEQTAYLDDEQLRQLETRHIYYQEINARKEVILKSLTEQNQLTPELQAQINACTQKQLLEDIYGPFKPKRRNKAIVAKEQGLEPLAIQIAEKLLDDASIQTLAKNFVKDDLDEKAVSEGARDILAQTWAENAELLQKMRQILQSNAVLTSTLKPENKAKDTQEKFLDYYEFSQALQDIPSHRLLALLRGQEQDVLQIKLTYLEQDTYAEHPLETFLKNFYQVPNLKVGEKSYQWLHQAMRWTWKIKLQLSLEQDVLNTAKDLAQSTAIDIFATNLKNLLMSSPAGAKNVLGLDPGFRTGVKAAVINMQGDVLATNTLFMHTQNQANAQIQTQEQFIHLLKKHDVQLIAIGNGTASRETDVWVQTVLKFAKIDCAKVIVNEAGASIYSASELASKELPDLDVSLRGAVSIARRLQDPLAELVKITPESIGVGQYQHDVDQQQLKYHLERVVQDCVNAVGVDVNTASPALLSYISGLNQNLAQQIVLYRQKNGPFKNRKQLKDVPRLGDKTFEQAAGFLRINGGDEPLDASSVHPESYQTTYQILKELNLGIDLLGKIAEQNFKQQKQALKQKYGGIVDDVLQELEKPARDPRPEFLMAKLAQDVQSITDLKTGMKLQGTVTNVAAFGAFIDIGVHQDGLVHISHVCEEFIDDIHKKVKVGQIVDVYVLEVDAARKRISLSIKKPSEKSEQFENSEKNHQGNKFGKSEKSENNFNKKINNNNNKNPQTSQQKSPQNSQQNSAMADKLKALFNK